MGFMLRLPPGISNRLQDSSKMGNITGTLHTAGQSSILQHICFIFDVVLCLFNFTTLSTFQYIFFYSCASWGKNAITSVTISNIIPNISSRSNNNSLDVLTVALVFVVVVTAEVKDNMWY